MVCGLFVAEGQAVLVSAVVPYMLKTEDNPHGVDRATFDQMGAALKADRAQFFSGFFKTFFGDGSLSKPVSEEVLEWARDTAMKASLKATLACAEAFATTDFRPDMEFMTVPTLILHGTADKTVPIDATARVAAGVLSDTHVIEYAGAPHGLFATHKDQMSADLLAFLRS